MPVRTECEKDGCAEDAGGNRYCRTHECDMGGCSMPSSSGDGTAYCRTHECAKSDCGERAYGNEYFCMDHLDGE